MKSRSEVLAEKKKTPASERTVPMFDRDEEKPAEKVSHVKSGTTVKCSACEEEMPLDKLEKRDDGAYECMHCAAPIRIGKTEPKSEEKPKGPKNPERKYCGECASEWPIVNGGFVINCGHVAAERVDHPTKAKRNKPPAGLQTRSQDVPLPLFAKSQETSETRPGPLSAQREGNKLFIPWGKARCPIDRFNAFEVGGFGLTVELSPGENVVEKARSMIAELRQIADIAFDEQKKWYLEKLAGLQKEDE